MNFINQIFYAFLMTVVTGTIAFGIWLVLRRICVYSAPTLPYLLLRMVCLLYVLPVCYICIQLTLRDGFLQVDGLWQMNFAPAGEMCTLVVLMLIGWIFLMGRQLRVCLFSYQESRRLNSYSMPEERPEVLAELARVKEKLGIRGKVYLYHNRHVASAYTVGFFRCQIVMPARTYSREELSVIFHHELMHYKSRDYVYRFLVKAVGVVEIIEPISSPLEEALKEWSEFCCDRKAAEALKDEMDAKRYFEVILGLTPVEGEPYVNHICSELYENQYRLRRRIDFMNKYGNAKKTAKGLLTAAALVFAITSATPVYALSRGVEGLHRTAYLKMENTVREIPDMELEEHFLPASADNTYGTLEYANPEAEVVMPALSADEVKTVNWTVSPNVRKVSTSFWVKAGQKIGMAASVAPASSSYWIGIMNDGNDVRYVSGTGSLSHNFEITKSGLYRVLVQNNSNVTITAGGSYYYYTP